MTIHQLLSIAIITTGNNNQIQISTQQLGFRTQLLIFTIFSFILDTINTAEKHLFSFFCYKVPHCHELKPIFSQLSNFDPILPGGNKKHIASEWSWNSNPGLYYSKPIVLATFLQCVQHYLKTWPACSVQITNRIDQWNQAEEITL